MHVQPEAATVKIGNRPLWAPGAPQAVQDFISARGGSARVLEFGSGGSTMFLLRQGATVTTVEHHELWAEALQEAAAARGLAAALKILRRDRPYHDVPAEFPDGETFDILLVDGRERIECLRKALPLVAPDGLVLLDDSQRDRYWPAFSLLGDRENVTYRSKARNTTIWSLGAASAHPDFVTKRFVEGESTSEPTRSAVLVPRELPSAGPVEPGYVRKVPIRDLDPVELDLQRLGLIEKFTTYVAPSLYELEDSSLRIDAGHKILRFGDGVFRGKGGAYVRSDETEFARGAVELPGRTLDLTASGAGRYSFFLLDSLPKLELLAAAGYRLADFDTILVNTGAKWVSDMLSPILGEHAPRIVAFSSQTPSVRMERSVHFEGLRSARFTPKWIHAYLERVFQGVALGQGAAAESFGPFVYISRQKATGRRIVNHDEFLSLIGPLGFREVSAEDHSPIALASGLRDAKVLISPHGAGLANLILTPRSTRIVELFSSHYTPQYFHLARDRDQDYRALACVDAEGLNVFDRYEAATANKAAFNREDVVVPIAALREMLVPEAAQPAAVEAASGSLLDRLRRLRFW